MTDAEAIILCQEGSRDAFRHLVERHQDTLYGTAVLMTGDKSVAEELVQDAFLDAWRGISGFRRGRPFKPWVVRILVNRVMSSRRRRTLPTAPLDDAERAPSASDVFESAMRGERRDVVRQALGRLSPQHHEVVTLRYFADLTLREVADALRLKQGTVKSRLSRALSRLREELTEICDRRRGDEQ